VLWYKYWLETRSLVLFMVVYALFPIALFTLSPGPANARQGSLAAAQRALEFLPIYYSMIAVLLAGSGIKPQAGPHAPKSFVGSPYFTLSLPVSRFRLVATRAGVGMLETVGILLIAPCAMWIILQPLRASVTGFDLFLFWVTLFACGSVLHSLGVLLSTFLDDPWRGFASMFGVLLLQMILSPLPPFLNIFRAMGPASPLVTHALPWASIGISLVASVALFLFAAKVFEMREY
jgi:hypothetical protein